MAHWINKDPQEAVTIKSEHIIQLREALDLEYDNRMKNLKFDTFLTYQKYYTMAKKQLARDTNVTIKITTLIWIHDQITKYGSNIELKNYTKSIMTWLPLAIEHPDYYEHYGPSDKEVKFTRPKKNQFDDELSEFLFHCQVLGEYFDLEFGDIYSEYVVNKKKLQLHYWILLKNLFGSDKMRKCFAKQFGIELKDVPKMKTYILTHLNQMQPQDPTDYYSALEIISAIKRHKIAILHTLMKMSSAKCWYDSKNQIIFNPLAKEHRFKVSMMISDVIDNDLVMTEEVRTYLNELVVLFGLRKKQLYKL